MKFSRPLIGDERGAIFIQVGLVLLVVMAFNVFVLDYGLLWIARGQAQNAADAGAIAGAMARAYDERSNPPASSGPAADISIAVANANRIWNEPGAASVSFECPTGVSGRCTRVDVHRDGSGGSSRLPALFGPIIGVTSQEVRATATAFTGNGNSTPCLRPIGFADTWNERRSPSTEFNYYVPGRNPAQVLSGIVDEYTAPNSTQPGRTRSSTNYGEVFAWDPSDWVSIEGGQPVTQRLMLPLNLPGSASFQQNMLNCVGQQIRLNDTIPIDLTTTDTQATQGLESIFQLDMSANYDYANSRIANSCAPSCAPISPRLIPVVLFDPQKLQLGLYGDDWIAAGCPTASPCVTVANIVGLFIHRVGPYGAGFAAAHGHLLRFPGSTSSAAPTFTDDASWLVTTHLIR